MALRLPIHAMTPNWSIASCFTVLNDSAGGMGVVAGLRVTAAPLRRSTMETVEALVSTRIWTGVHSHLDGVYAGVGAREDVAHDASRRGEMRFLERAEARGLVARQP
jgi:hypothetical protein